MCAAGQEQWVGWGPLRLEQSSWQLGQHGQGDLQGDVGLSGGRGSGAGLGAGLGAGSGAGSWFGQLRG